MMKKLSVIAIATLLVISSVGCNKSEKDSSLKSEASQTATSSTEKAVDISGVKSFSFKDESKIWEGANSGAIKSGFENTTETSITNKEQAIAQAEKEGQTNIKYDNAEVFYDTSAKMWKVHFSNDSYEGGPAIIMDEKGITKYILLGQ